MNDRLEVLDKGYVRLVDTFGSDLNVVNCARVSYDKEVDRLSDRDKGLIRFLWSNGHGSPFRNQAVQYEVYAPLMVARQWYKYHVASNHTEDQDGWNESSRRYITEDPAFYVPSEWRTAPANSKQGSGHPTNNRVAQEATQRLVDTIDRCMVDYEWALQQGIAPEQARLLLPAYGMYVRWRWTVSLAGVLHFLTERLASDAQTEIREYAQAVEQVTRPKFPITFSVAMGDTDE